MATWRLDLSYDGGGFRGYARQEGQRTVQEKLESALMIVLGPSVETAVAGRTDAGVHARGQVVSFQHDDLEPGSLLRSLNGIVGPEIAIMAVTKTPDDFNARFSAIWRRYRYLIDVGPAADPLRRHEAWFPERSLDIDAMQKAAGAFIGEHDFSAFCRSIEGRSNTRRVEESRWVQTEGMLEFWIRANSFCHQMVRSLVGFSFDVGRGFADPETTSQVISAGDRSSVATVAPAHGLTLWEVGY